MTRSLHPGPVIHVVGWLVSALGVAMLVPAVADLMAYNPDWQTFVAGAGLTIFAGGSMVILTRGQPMDLNLRQGFLLTLGSWVAAVFVGALPFVLSRLDLDLTDAVFESMSGLTTTGSTILAGLDALPPGLHLWRALLQWLGGIGIIVMGVAILPFLRVGGMQLFRLESSDRSDRIVPRFRQYILAIFAVYAVLTIVCVVALAVAGFSTFNAVIHAMTTLSTGGFSTSDGSVGHFANPTAEWILVVFMLAGSLPFIIYIRLLQGQANVVARNSQVLGFLRFVVVVVLAIAWWLWRVDGVAPWEALRLAAFNVVSIVTTTGYATTDYTQWGTLPLGTFFLLTFVGGCTGSTAGGLKIFRFQLLRLSIRAQVRRLIYPNAVTVPTYDEVPVSADVLSGGLLYIGLYLATVAAGSIALEALGVDLVTALTAAATAVGNVGPGLGQIIGPAGNFAGLPDAAKWLLALAMLLGRLEFFTVLVLLAPVFWRE